MLDEKGIPKLVLNQDGMVQFDSETTKKTLRQFLAEDPEGQKLAGLTGGVQGGVGTLNGNPYSVGGFLDLMHESYGGSHDFISGTLSGFYDDNGNATRGLTESQRIAYEIWAGLALLPATPFALSEALPPEAWKVLNVLVK